MARKIAKCRLCRREGVKLFLKGSRCFSPKCPLERKGAVPPGMHGTRSSFRKSEYSFQLREKQKAKRLYGLRERQFKNYYQKIADAANRGEEFLRQLEKRLDNVVYRLGFAPSRSAARQLVRHGHIWVGNRKVRIPSRQVKVGEKVILAEKAAKIPYIAAWLKSDYRPPAWLKRKANQGEVLRLPKRSEMPPDVDESLIVEFYSR